MLPILLRSRLCSTASQFVFCDIAWPWKVAIMEGKKGAGTGRETSLRLLSALFIINYVCIIVFLLPALEKKLKRAIVFLIPWVESIYHAAARHIGRPADRDWMESHSRDACGIVSYYVACGPEYLAKINYVPCDGIFNLGERKMLIFASGKIGRRVSGHSGGFLGVNVNRMQTQIGQLEWKTCSNS